MPNVNDMALANAYAKGFVSTDEANFQTAFDNLFTGNLDYRRQLELQQNEFVYDTLMSNSAYQRAVNDIKAAGLNPNMLYSRGGNGEVYHGGSSGSGATSKQGWSLVGNVLTTLLASAFKVATTSMYNETKAQSDLIRANTALDVAHLRGNSETTYYDAHGKQQGSFVRRTR